MSVRNWNMTCPRHGKDFKAKDIQFGQMTLDGKKTYLYPCCGSKHHFEEEST